MNADRLAELRSACTDAIRFALRETNYTTHRIPPASARIEEELQEPGHYETQDETRLALHMLHLLDEREALLTALERIGSNGRSDGDGGITNREIARAAIAEAET